MNYVSRIEVKNSVHNLAHYYLAAGLINFTGVLQEVLEWFSPDQLHYNIEIFVIVNTLMKLNDIWMLHAHDNLNLLLEKLAHELASLRIWRLPHHIFIAV